MSIRETIGLFDTDSEDVNEVAYDDALDGADPVDETPYDPGTETTEPEIIAADDESTGKDAPIDETAQLSEKTNETAGETGEAAEEAQSE